VKWNVFMYGVGLVDPERMQALLEVNFPPEIRPLSGMDKAFGQQCLEALPRVEARFDSVRGLTLWQILQRWGDRLVPQKEQGLYLLPTAHLCCPQHGGAGDPQGLLMYHHAEAEDETGRARTLTEFARSMASAPRAHGEAPYGDDEIARLMRWLIADSRLI
jgi:hypothetical protein